MNQPEHTMLIGFKIGARPLFDASFDSDHTLGSQVAAVKWLAAHRHLDVPLS